MPDLPPPAPPLPAPSPSPALRPSPALSSDPLLSPPRLLPASRGASDPPESVADLLVRAGAAVLADRRERAARHGLSLTALAVLGVLADTDGPAQRELAALVRVRPATLTPVLDALETDGLVTRGADGGDRRVRRVRITGTGRERLGRAAPAGRGPCLPAPPARHADVIGEYLFAVVASLEQDHRGQPL